MALHEQDSDDSISDDIRRRAAIHEAAHAVIAHTCGWPIDHIWVLRRFSEHPDFNGRIRLLVRRHECLPSLDRMYYVVAGHVAELIEEYTHENGSVPATVRDLHYLMDGHDSEPETTDRFSVEWQEFHDNLRRRTEESLRTEPSARTFRRIWFETLDCVTRVLVHQWPSLERLAAAALSSSAGRLTGREISELLDPREEQPFEIPACVPASLLATAKAPLLRQLISRPGVGRTPRKVA